MKRDADAAFGSPAGPSSISLPSPPADSQEPASPSPDDFAGPSRKRSRSEVTPEERKEARAHRNRIAAQNSRDRRKAQFSYLEQRVTELEEENRKLRAGMSLAELSRSVEPSHEQHEKELAREKENAELREKVKTLENGWEAVMKALAASGLPLAFPLNTASTPSSTPSSSSDSASQPPTTTFPVIIPPNPIFPLSPASTASPILSSHVDFDETDSTRHLARVATTDAPPLSSVPLQRVVSDRLSFNSSSLLQFLIRPQLTSASVLRQRPQLMRWPWRTFSGKSSHRAPPSRRRLCLLVSPPAKPPRHPKSRPPWPHRR